MREVRPARFRDETRERESREMRRTEKMNGESWPRDPEFPGYEEAGRQFQEAVIMKR